jgi:hypothetical protein
MQEEGEIAQNLMKVVPHFQHSAGPYVFHAWRTLLRSCWRVWRGHPGHSTVLGDRRRVQKSGRSKRIARRSAHSTESAP